MGGVKPAGEIGVGAFGIAARVGIGTTGEVGWLDDRRRSGHDRSHRG